MRYNVGRNWLETWYRRKHKLRVNDPILLDTSYPDMYYEYWEDKIMNDIREKYREHKGSGTPELYILDNGQVLTKAEKEMGTFDTTVLDDEAFDHLMKNLDKLPDGRQHKQDG